MRLFFFFSLMMFSFCSFGQNERPVLQNDTIYYANNKFYYGKIVRLKKGSKENADFAHVFIGSSKTSKSPLPQIWKNMSVLVEDVYKKSGKYFVKGDLYKGNEMVGLAGNKVTIDIEHALDDKEIVEY